MSKVEGAATAVYHGWRTLPSGAEVRIGRYEERLVGNATLDKADKRALRWFGQEADFVTLAVLTRPARRSD